MKSHLGRLTKDKEFDLVFKKGKSSYNNIIGIKCLAVGENSSGETRLGILVSNKVSKKAVERNKIRRRIRESFRLQVETVQPGHDFVVIALPEALKKEYKDIDSAIAFNLRRLRVKK